VNFYRNGLFHLARNITKNLPFNITKNFFDSRERSLHWFFKRECIRIDRKCDWLAKKQTLTLHSKIKPLKYYCLSPNFTTSDTSPSPNEKKFSLSNPSSHHGSALEISINPLSFNNILTSPLPPTFFPLKRIGSSIYPLSPFLLTSNACCNWVKTFLSHPPTQERSS